MVSSVKTLLDLLTRPEFIVGIALGLAALLILGTLKNRSYWGLALAASVGIGINFIVDQRLFLVVGLVVLGIGGWLLQRHSSNETIRYLGWVVVSIGAVIVSFKGGVASDPFLRVGTATLIIVSGSGLNVWSTQRDQTWLGTLFAISAFGIWTTVPETDSARLLLGAAMPLALSTFSQVGARLSSPGAFSIAGVVGWVAATGGSARPASVIGAWSSLGLLVLLPLLWRSSRDLEPLPSLIVHTGVVVVAARGFGLWENTGLAAIASLALGVAAYFVASQLAPKPGSRDQSPGLRP